jgi:hypothetical protein
MKRKHFPDLTPTRHVPRHHPRWELTAEGARRASFYEDGGVVEVFSYKGDARCGAFTSFDMWLCPHLYHLTLRRHYHDLWLGRLAHRFAWECAQIAKGDSQL